MPVLGEDDITAVARRTKSPVLSTTDPLACLAMRPVLSETWRPPMVVAIVCSLDNNPMLIPYWFNVTPFLL